MTEPTAYQRKRIARDAEVAKARAAERNRRNVEARRRAWSVLADRHAAEFAVLLASETAGVYAERGPLPGDTESTITEGNPS